MRVCLISHSSTEGGAQTVLIETVEVLKEHGVDCRVLLPGPGQIVEELKRLDTPCHIVPFPLWMGREGYSLWTRARQARWNLFATVPVLAKIREWNPDVIFTNTISVGIGSIVALLLGIPHVWHLHEFGYEDHGLVFLLGDRVSYAAIRKLSSAYIANSKAVAEKYVHHLSPSKLRTIYYSMHRARRIGVGTEEAFCMPPRKSRWRCVIAGTLCEGKGQRDAIEALAELAGRGIRPELLILGRGDRQYEEYLRDLVRRHHLGEQVVFTGQVPDAVPFMQSADMVLVCSRSEAFGRVTVEGMLVERPVIGARSGATPELIQEGSTGLLYAPGDPRDLAEKIRFICHNPDAAAELGANARKWAENAFSRDRYGRELLEVLIRVSGDAR